MPMSSSPFSLALSLSDTVNILLMLVFFFLQWGSVTAFAAFLLPDLSIFHYDRSDPHVCECYSDSGPTNAGMWGIRSKKKKSGDAGCSRGTSHLFVALSEGLEVEDGVCICQCVYVEESSGCFGICCSSAVKPLPPSSSSSCLLRSEAASLPLPTFTWWVSSSCLEAKAAWSPEWILFFFFCSALTHLLPCPSPRPYTASSFTRSSLNSVSIWPSYAHTHSFFQLLIIPFLLIVILLVFSHMLHQLFCCDSSAVTHGN